MVKSGLPKSARKFIRREKSRIRREALDLKEQEKLISEIYSKLLKTNLNDKKVIKLKAQTGRSAPCNCSAIKQNAKLKTITQNPKPL